VGEYSTASSLWPNVSQVSPRTDTHPPTPNGPQGSSLSTPDGSMSVPVLSSGSSPSLSQHHPTPSPVSSFILYTPDQNLRHPEGCYQPFPYIANHTSSQRRPAGSLTSRHLVRNASRPSTMEIKQPKATLKNTPQVSGYRKIAPASPGCIKPQGESSSRKEKKRVRRESKETLNKTLGLSRKPVTQSLPVGTVVFTRPLTPTTVHERSFDTSSRKIDEKIIERVGVNSEAGHSIAPKVQEELWEGNAPTHARAHATERTLAMGQVFSKEAKAGGSTSASRRGTSTRFPPAKPQNTSTLPTLGKRQKRGTTDSNSSSNSSKTLARRSRTNSHEDQKLTSSSSQQISDPFEGRTRSVRKNSGRVGNETSAATSVPRTKRATTSRIGVPVCKQRGLVLLGGGTDAVERALGRPGLGPTQKKSMSYRKSPSHSPGYQTGWEAKAATANDFVMGSATSFHPWNQKILNERTYSPHSPAVDRGA